MSIEHVQLRDYSTVYDVADRLAIHPESVRRLIRNGTLAGKKFGTQWLIQSAYLELFAHTYVRAPGRKPAARSDKPATAATIYRAGIITIYAPQSPDDRPVNKNRCRAACRLPVVEANHQCGRFANRRLVIDGHSYAICWQHAAIHQAAQREAA